MHKIFLLIQKDIETGPYALEELLQLTLQIDDLVWVIGKSEEWCSPLKVSILQPYLYQADGKLYIKQEVISAIQANVFICPTSGLSPLSSGNIEYTPSSLETKLLHNIEKRLTLLEQKEYTALPESVLMQSNKELAIEINEQGEPVYQKQKQLKQDYESLKKGKEPKREEIKEEQKIEKKNMPLLLALLALMVFLVWTAYSNKVRKTGEVSVVTLPKSQPEQIKNYTKTDEVTPATTEKSSKPVLDKEPAVTYTKSVEEQNFLPIDTYLDSIRTILNQQDLEITENFVLPTQVYKSYRYKPYISGNKKVNGNRQHVASKRKVPLNQQVALQSKFSKGNKQTLTGLEVMVRNNSPELLKTVSVDVFYYKKGERLFDKETMYFKNVHPHQSLTLSIPGNNKATSARFQLGTITSANTVTN